MPEAATRFDDSAAYERFMGRWSRAVGTVFLEWVAPPAGARWLDIGCGTGVFTRLVLDSCSPAAVSAVDPSNAQIEFASRQPFATQAHFQVADAQALPFSDSTFDVVVAALAINFIPDRLRALFEMRRVVRPRGLIAGYVWDFAAERSPSWPLRRGMRQVGVNVPHVPGARDSTLHGLQSLFECAELEEIASRSFEVTVPFLDFNQFWRAQTPSDSPLTKIVAAMSEKRRAQLIEAVRTELTISENGWIEYAARANAIRACIPA
jgi:ubiquinone/menaquinone biosynthesis C-methylase UbiE